MVSTPTVPSAWKIVPPVLSWLPYFSLRAPPLADLPWPHRLDQPFPQHPTSCPLCPYPAFLIFLAIALILPEMTLHAYLYTCLSTVHSPEMSNPQRQTHCRVHCCSTSTWNVGGCIWPGLDERLLDVEWRNNMRGRCHFPSFVIEEVESERCNMPHNTGSFFPHKKV